MRFAEVLEEAHRCICCAHKHNSVQCLFGDRKSRINHLTLKKLLRRVDESAKAELKAALHCNKIHSAAVKAIIYIDIDVVAASAAPLQKRKEEKKS